MSASFGQNLSVSLKFYHFRFLHFENHCTILIFSVAVSKDRDWVPLSYAGPGSSVWVLPLFLVRFHAVSFQHEISSLEPAQFTVDIQPFFHLRTKYHDH